MRVGILGPGGIARIMGKTLNKMKGVTAQAVGSRDYSRAKAFAEEFNIPHVYGSYEELVSSDKVDLIYVASPHGVHHEHMKLCLEHGKPVLCEKTFTLSAVQAKDILNLGKKKNLLVTEAIWTRYMPMRKVMDHILDSGVIGRPHFLTANLCYNLATNQRLFNRELGGSSLLELGVYAIHFALMSFGYDIKDISTNLIKDQGGIETESIYDFIYTDGRMAQLQSSNLIRGDRRGMVFGEKGYIEFLNINNCEGILVYDMDGKCIATHKTPKQITGFEYQVASCKKALENGRIECPEIPHAEIIQTMEIIDRIKKIGGIKFPNEDKL
ncbi:MAG: Gfo/Idh/MocA family oxidoreductase [Treponema sp.]|nr:Gfo/Idh/MocA family oxidoreductase [Treponema sp.]